MFHFLIGFILGWALFEASQKSYRPVSSRIYKTWDRWSTKQQKTYEDYQVKQAERRFNYWKNHGI